LKATAHRAEGAIVTSDIFVEFLDILEFTLYFMDLTVEVIRNSTCAAIILAPYAKRCAHLNVIGHILEQTVPVWACYQYIRKTDHIIKDGLDRVEQNFNRLQKSKVSEFFPNVAYKWF
jgi:hypothetical protein